MTQLLDRNEFQLAVEIAHWECPIGFDLDERIFWSKEHPTKLTEDYQECVILHDARFLDCPSTIKNFKDLFKLEFGLSHDVKWIGIMTTFQHPDKISATNGHYDAAFLIHNQDVFKLCISHRLNLGFYWLGEVISSHLFPKDFKSIYYAGFRPRATERTAMETNKRILCWVSPQPQQ